jgi:integrase
MSTRNSWGAIRKLPSKRFQASYIGPDGERHTAPDTFATKSEASFWLAQMRVCINDGSWVSPRLTVTVNSVPNFEAYALRHIALQTNRKGELLRENTKSVYRRILRTNLKPFLTADLDSISKSQIQEWYASLVATGKRTAASKAYKLLSAVLKRAVEDDLIAKNPCNIRGAHSASTGKTVNIPTSDEVIAISNAIKPAFKNMVMIAAYGGFRFSELTELRRKDVKTVETNGQVSYVIRVERAVTFADGVFTVAKPKSDMSTRDVSMPVWLTPLINDHLFNEVPDDAEALLFPGASDGHLPHYVFIKAWGRALKKAGITRAGITPHSLRHFAGTHYHLAGATLPELMKWLGDSSIAAVQRYLHVTNRAATIASQMEISPDYEVVERNFSPNF